MAARRGSAARERLPALQDQFLERAGIQVVRAQPELVARSPGAQDRALGVAQ
jgi:hypothetical protein